MGKISRFKENWNRPSLEDNLSYREIAGFSASAAGQDIFWGLRGQVKTIVIAVFGIDPIKFGKLGLFSGIWDAINDPIMGILIDRTDTKWGKLRPYMLVTAFPIAILTMLSFFNIPIGQSGKFVFVAVVYILWEMAYTVSDVPFGALSSVMTSNTVQRTKLVTVSRYGSEIAMALPGLISFAVSIVGIKYMGPVFFAGAIVLSTLGAALFSTSFFTIKERVPPAPNKQTAKEIWGVLKNSRPMLVLVASELMGVVNSVSAFTSWYFFLFAFKKGIGWPILRLFSKEAEGVGLQNLMAIIRGAPTFIAMAFTPKIVKYFGLKGLTVIAGLAKAFAYFTVYLIGYNTTSKLLYMIFILTITGIPDNMMMIVRKTLSSDALDYAEYKTGERSEGLLGSMIGFAVKLKDAIVVFFGGFALSWVGLGRVDGIERTIDEFLKMSPDTHRLFMLFALFPAIGAILQVLPYLFYDFTGEKKQTIVNELEKSRKIRHDDLVLKGYVFDQDISVKDFVKKVEADIEDKKEDKF
ncbi:MAG: MFS transporter [Eubacteriales bacterium]